MALLFPIIMPHYAITKKVNYTLAAGVVWYNKNMYLKQEILDTF